MRYNATSKGNIPFTPEEEMQADIAEAELIAQIPKKQQAINKQQATLLLQQTDWTATIDIADPNYSNPYLINQIEFLTYRSLVRKIVLDPPTTIAVFPEIPTEIWSN